MTTLQNILAANKISKSKSLDISNLQLNELPKELSEFTWLTRLYFHHNNICNLTPLANLTNLEIIGCSNNIIIDVSPLAKLVNLKTLFAQNNLITDTTPLVWLINLVGLFHISTKVYY